VRKTGGPPGRVELIGGGSRAILMSIPTADSVEQTQRPGKYIEAAFAPTPPRSVAARARLGPQTSGRWRRRIVAYTLVDDLPLSPRIRREELFGTYIAEDRGKSVGCFRAERFALSGVVSKAAEKRLPSWRKAQGASGGAVLRRPTWKNSAAGPALSSRLYGRLVGEFSLRGEEFFLVEDGDAGELMASICRGRRDLRPLRSGADGVGAADKERQRFVA